MAVDWRRLDAFRHHSSTAIPAAGVAPPGPAPTPAWTGGTITPRRADDLVDSWGIAAHFTYTSYVSKGIDAIAALIQAAGIRWVRDGIDSGATTMADVAATFTNRNLSLRAVLSPGSDLSLTRVQSFHDQYAANFGSRLLSVEAWNEPGGYTGYTAGSTLASQVLQWQKWIWQVYRTTSNVYQGIPIAGPSLADSNSSTKWGALNLTGYADMANLHDYPGNSYVMTDTDFTRFINNGNLMVNTNRRMSSETGASNGQTSAPGYTVPGPDGVAVTLPRVQWEHFRRGWDLSSTYEFLDEATDGTFEHSFGLVDNSLNPKPAYTAVKNTLTTLADPGGTFTVTPLNVTLTGQSGSTRSVLLQKRDGSYWWAVWEQVQAVSSTDGSLLAAVSVPVTLTFDRARTVTVIDPRVNTTGTTSGPASTATVTSTQAVTLVKIV